MAKNPYDLSGKGGRYGGIKKQYRMKPGSRDRCDYGTTGARDQAPGSGAPFNRSARSTMAGHETLKKGLAAAKSGPGSYKHPYGSAVPEVY